jgi:hypothetical protein
MSLFDEYIFVPSDAVVLNIFQSTIRCSGEVVLVLNAYLVYVPITGPVVGRFGCLTGLSCSSSSQDRVMVFCFSFGSDWLI